MKVFLSVFQNKKCSSCNRAFQITWKRRQCAECRKSYLEQLFCTDCSIKVKASKKLILGHRRYCLQCHSLIEKKNKSGSQITPSIREDEEKTLEEEKSVKEDKKIAEVVSSSSLEEEKDSVIIKKPAFIQGIKRRISLIIKTQIVPSSSVSFNQDPNTRYTIKRELYTNANTAIYLVESKTDSYNYILKRILPQDEEEKSLMIEEITIHQTSFHPNILKYHDSYLHDGYIWIVIEKYESNLFQLLSARAGFIPEKFMSYICKEILKGLGYLHKNHRIHRDIKSKNILLSENGDVKLGEFGYAAQVSETTSLKNANPSWMAPELLLGEEYNENVDIWSLGILLFEMAEGEPPFNDENRDNIINSIVYQPAPKLKNKLKWTRDFANFISFCLRKEPIERLPAESLLCHPFIEENDEETSKQQFAEYYNNFRSEFEDFSYFT